MRIFTFLPALAFIILTCSCCSVEEDAEGPALGFNQDSTFKIAQFTDTHICISSNPAEYAKALDQLKFILDTEKPDMAVFTGDVVTDIDGKRAWKEFLTPLDDRNIPFAVVLGNHDREQDLSEREIMDLVMAHPANINVAAEGGYLDDFAVEIKDSLSGRTAAVLYLMDSNDYSNSEYFDDYGWITNEQIQWYVSKSKSFAEKNGDVPVPSYAFFHIPLAEYSIASARKAPLGSREEDECPGELNSGLLAAMVECGDVQGVFVGHDHDNDYLADFGGVSLVYGRYSGYNTVYNDLRRGVRIIELKEGDYGFRTWIRERDGGAVEDTTVDKRIDFALRKASAPDGTENGIRRTEYEIGDLTIDDFPEKGTIVDSAVVPSPRIPARDDAPAHGFVYEGFIMLPQSGAWSFHVTGDDFAVVTVDDFTFDSHFYGRGQKKMNLEKGLHRIKIKFINKDGGERLKLQWRRQDCARYHEIPQECYFIK